MCLCSNQHATTRLRNKMRRSPSKSVLLHKVYMVRGDCLTAPYNDHCLGGCLARSGWIQSDRKKAGQTTNEYFDRRVNRGCHVFTTYQNAKDGKSRIDRCLITCRSTVIVPVRGYLKDFVAAGYGEAVFTKLYLTKKNFQQAMNGRNGP